MITWSMNVAEIFALVASLHGPRLRALIDAAQDVAVNSAQPGFDRVAQHIMDAVRVLHPKVVGS